MKRNFIVVKFKYLFVTLIVATFLSSAIPTDKDLTIGATAPSIEFTDGGIKKFDDGKFRIINFWSPKHPVSRIRNKEISDFFINNNIENVEFITICTDSDNELAREVMKYDGITSQSTSLFRNEILESVIKDYGAEHNMATYLLNPAGKIIKMGKLSLADLETI